MYEQYFGLLERPFDLSPDPRFLFLSKGHKEALAHLKYGLSGRPGVTLIVGEAGTGKTTVARAALQSVGRGKSLVVHLSNPTLTRAEFFEFLADGFGFSGKARASKTVFLQELADALTQAALTGSILAVVVDEAQSLPQPLLEEIRLLMNTESMSRHAVALALIGQPELSARLNDPHLRQLKQRVTLRCELSPFDVNETAAYVASRVRVAGGAPERMFTRDAIRAIHEHSGGLPRTISVICDNALVNGFAADTCPVGRDIVLEVCREFALGSATAGRGATPLVPPAAAAGRGDDAANAATAPSFSMWRPRRFSFF